MYELILPASEFRITYIHRADNLDLIKTWAWLDTMLKDGKLEDVPKITAVLDTNKKENLVYDGNKRMRHAKKNNYNLKSAILLDQADLSMYLLNHSKLWFGITDFVELLEYMRYYAQYPVEDAEMPREWKERIDSKHYEWQRRQKRELFGWDDD